jgi:hypothetical protein
MQAVYSEGDASLIGRVVPLRIIAAGPNSLAGEITQGQERE